jgi:hypothetical protein
MSEHRLTSFGQIRPSRRFPVTDRRDGKDDRTNEWLAERAQFGFIFVATFVVFLAAAFVALLLPWTWSRRFESNEARWFVGRAWDDASTFTELAFMG